MLLGGGGRAGSRSRRHQTGVSARAAVPQIWKNGFIVDANKPPTTTVIRPSRRPSSTWMLVVSWIGTVLNVAASGCVHRRSTRTFVSVGQQPPAVNRLARTRRRHGRVLSMVICIVPCGRGSVHTADSSNGGNVVSRMTFVVALPRGRARLQGRRRESPVSRDAMNPRERPYVWAAVQA